MRGYETGEVERREQTRGGGERGGDLRRESVKV
jgi:hypothetical protein